jgi:hypothetical protein
MQADELPPPVQMAQLLAGFQLSQALYAAAVLGVADHLVAGPAPVAVLAETPARTRRPCTGCCARWPARACSPNPNPASSP